MQTEQQKPKRAPETRINLVADPDLVARLRQHQAELERTTGLPVSMSAAAVRLLRRGLEGTAAQA